MQEKDLRLRFFMALARLKGWNPATQEKENSLEIKAITDRFIFQVLNEEEQDILIRRAKTHRMPIPLTFDAMKTSKSAERQIISITTLMEAADTWEEFEGLQGKVASKKGQVAEQSVEQEEPLSDFDRILLGIMSVPKSELDKTKDDGKETV